MPTATPPALPTSRASAPIFYLIYLALTLFPVVTVLVFLLRVLPAFKDVFKDFKSTLPKFTEHMLELSDMVVYSGGWIAILLVALAVPILPARWSARQSSRMTRFNRVFLAFNVLFLFNLILLSLGATALFLPLVKLVRSVSGADPG
jgi:type II secretory pathway component PulF